MNIATFRQARKLLELIDQKETSSDQLKWLLERGFISDLLEASRGLDRESFREFLKLEGLVPDFTVAASVDVTLPELSVTFDERVAAGGYDFVNAAITEQRFGLTLPTQLRKLAVVSFKRNVNSAYVLRWALEHGYDLALIDDLLVFGALTEYRSLWSRFPIIALGSSTVVRENIHVPGLETRDSNYDLDLGWCDEVWGLGWQFLLVARQASVAHDY